MPDDKPAPPYAVVEWDDAWEDTKRVLEDEEYYESGYIMHDAGWLKTDGDRVIVCRQYSDSASHDQGFRMFANCLSVPRTMVRRLTVNGQVIYVRDDLKDAK